MNKTTFLALAALAVSACTTHADGTTSTNKTAVGAGIGALAGGVLGNRLDKDNRARGTVSARPPVPPLAAALVT